MLDGRDDFAIKVREVLAKRAGQRCSNPDCGAVTSGPHADEQRAINLGVAAHITAASSGGPRYSEKMLPEQRADITNGIWLCQSCAKLVDSDTKLYTEERLLIWKRRHEEAVKAQLGVTSPVPVTQRTPGKLVVSAIYQQPSADNRSCILDVRVSNHGDSDVLINAVEFRVIESLQKMLLGHADYSAQYDLDISKLLEYGARADCQVAQRLVSGEADRFAIVLSAPSIGPVVAGWRFATTFKTNFGDLFGPEVEVWLPGPAEGNLFDEIIRLWSMKARAHSFVIGKEFRKLASRPTDPGSPDWVSYSTFTETGGGAIAFPSEASGYETRIAYGLTIGFYRGLRPLWERRGGKSIKMKFGTPDEEAAKVLHQIYGADAPKKAELRHGELVEQGNVKMAERWKRVLKKVRWLIRE